jgi:pyridoxamine 5'-phosphate oxidase
MKLSSHVSFNQIKRAFDRLLAKAKKTGLNEPTAMALATADSKGRPSVRTVLLKGFDERGFVFYTNLKSRKGRQLADNPHAALCFWWDPLKFQVTIEGTTESVDPQQADQYWKTRPRNSQIGGWASHQSQPLKSLSYLLMQAAKLKLSYVGKEVPRPPHWSGYRLRPTRIEFWRSRPFRLHERLLYTLSKGRWSLQKLYP